jgi:nitrogen fixation/metabolism regulation signal transduction histidine kinase
MRRLGQAFNSMAERLEAAMAALRQAEREAAWRTVAQRLAHEFKNILTPMSLSLHLLADRSARAPDDAERAEALGALERGVSHLGRLAEQFSQYARLPEPRLEPLDLATLARSAAPAGEVQVAADAQVAVAGDSLLLSRAIHNLVLNAVEASAAGAIVEVRVRAERPHAVLEVLDRGAGVPAEIATRIFEPYVSSKQRGSGLGLALVRDIAQQHGGDVTLEPREGGGTRARLTLPLAGPAPAEGASPGGG